MYVKKLFYVKYVVIRFNDEEFDINLVKCIKIMFMFFLIFVD